MSNSVSWQRYDNEYNVSGLMTEAARACVSAQPTDVKDFLSRYFREVANGTSVKVIHQEEVLNADGEAALTFTLELCAGSEVTATTRDLILLSTGAARDERIASSPTRKDAIDDRRSSRDECTVLQNICAAAVSQLSEHGYVEPQADWDSALQAAFAASASAFEIDTTSIQWVLSIMASLVSAKQRRLPLHRYLSTLVDDCRRGRLAPGGSPSIPARAGVAGASKVPISSENPVRGCTVPQLLLTFLVNSACADAPEAANGVRFSQVYVALDTLTSSVDEGCGDAGTTPVSGTVLRQRVRKVRKAAGRFLQTHMTSSRVSTGGILEWDGTANLSDVVKAVTEALSAAELNVGTEVCLGLSMGASTMHAPVADKIDGSVFTNTSGDRSMSYHLFGSGEPPVTGDQLSEYVKEQLNEVDPNIVQFLEDTHATEDGVARQRLQMAVQDFILLTDVGVIHQPMGFRPPGLASSSLTPAQDGAFPNHAVNPCDYGSMTAAIEVMCLAGEESHKILTVVIDSAAGDAQTAANLVDVAIAGGASYVILKTGIFGSCTTAVASRLASRTEELTSKNTVAPRLPAQRFNRYDWPPLPTTEIKPIRRKGDKKKKETGKANQKRK
ncbi:hypothetical protein JKF63_02740 [Porcisia hertigi]|uniref:Phosphopyruvate hydratase n=1 Tax=Porcisia hertigi TaxID=2761500 RepID=A0A836IK85_9TRYP|nr:hypothetical protein JKF63_02740 [Porcisia hertigi]